MDTDPVAVARADGERIVWRQAAPAQSLIGERLFGIAFCVAFAAFGLVALTSALAALRTDPHADVLLPTILGCVFSAIGIPGLIYGLVDLPTAWSTHYVLTDRRLIIQSGRRTASYRRVMFEKNHVRERNGRGTIQFALGPMGRRGTDYHGRLQGVDDPRRIAMLILSTLPKSTLQAPPHDMPIAPRGAGDPVTALLKSGERIVWRQRAPPVVLALRKLLLLLPIGFLSLGAVMPAHAVMTTPDPGLGRIAFMGLFVVVFGGLTLILAGAVVREVIDGWSTTYVLTDRRLFVVTRTKVQVLTPAAFAQVDRAGGARRGVIHLMQGMVEDDRGVPVTLVGVEEPARVEALILETPPPRR